jgi:hypothetical protein
VKKVSELKAQLCYGGIKMANLVMCSQMLCPNAGHCCRVQAKTIDWQSVAIFDYTISLRGVECKAYIPMYCTVVTNLTRGREYD